MEGIVNRAFFCWYGTRDLETNFVVVFFNRIVKLSVKLSVSSNVKTYMSASVKMTRNG